MALRVLPILLYLKMQRNHLNQLFYHLICHHSYPLNLWILKYFPKYHVSNVDNPQISFARFFSCCQIFLQRGRGLDFGPNTNCFPGNMINFNFVINPNMHLMTNIQFN